MKSKMDLAYVKRDNSNIVYYDADLAKALRKERFKKAKPDLMHNEMAGEQKRREQDPGSDFKLDIERFCNLYLSEREAKIFKAWVFGGTIRQAEIGKMVGVSQAVVSIELNLVLDLFKKYYFEKGEDDDNKAE